MYKVKLNFCIFSFLIVIILPAILTSVAVLTGKKIDYHVSGYYSKVEIPKLSKNNLLNGSVQQALEKFWNSKMIGKGIFIKAFCEIQFNAFKISKREIGLDDYLFEFPYIKSACNLSLKNPGDVEIQKKKLDEYADMLASIQEKLKSLDKQFLYLITPSKAEMFYEKIPLKYRRKAPENRFSPMEYLTKAFDEKGINYLNSYDYFDSSAEYPPFYKGGIHWSRPFEQIFSSAVIKKVKALTGKNYPELVPGNLCASSQPYERDDDLVEIINVSKKLDSEYFCYETSFETAADFDYPRIAVQGGSFAKGLYTDYFETYPDHYYNIFYDRAYSEHSNSYDSYVSINDFNELRLKEYVEDIDCFIIESNESTLLNFSNGFVSYLDDYLKKQGHL